MVGGRPSRSQVHADRRSACSTRFRLRLVQCGTLAQRHAQRIIHPPTCLSCPRLQPHAARRHPNWRDKPSSLRRWAPESYGDIRTPQIPNAAVLITIWALNAEKPYRWSSHPLLPVVQISATLITQTVTEVSDRVGLEWGGSIHASRYHVGRLWVPSSSLIFNLVEDFGHLFPTVSDIYHSIFIFNFQQ